MAGAGNTTILCPPSRSTVSFLKEAYRATATKCGVALFCKQSKQVDVPMFLCEACREWYRLACLADSRAESKKEEEYLCPEHVPDGKVYSILLCEKTEVQLLLLYEFDFAWLESGTKKEVGSCLKAAACFIRCNFTPYFDQ